MCTNTKKLIKTGTANDIVKAHTHIEMHTNRHRQSILVYRDILVYLNVFGKLVSKQRISKQRIANCAPDWRGRSKRVSRPRRVSTTCRRAVC